MPSPHRRRGFTLIEFLVAVGIIAILVAILLPIVLTKREEANRAQCFQRLGQIGAALQQYARENGTKFLQPLPETVYDPAHKPCGYVAFTGPDESHPFAAGSAVKPNDITASLWLLIRQGDIRDPAVFICPSTSDVADRLTDADGAAVPATHRSNFRLPSNLSYSYASPFTDAPDFAFSIDRLPGDYALMADKNPGFDCDGTRVLGPARDAPPFQLARGNSPNHQHAGQNVLHPGGDVSFEASPYCGVNHDNIYTAAAPHRQTADATKPPDTPGYFSPDLGPANYLDSYLAPSARDGQ